MNSGDSRLSDRAQFGSCVSKPRTLLGLFVSFAASEFQQPLRFLKRSDSYLRVLCGCSRRSPRFKVLMRLGKHQS